MGGSLLCVIGECCGDCVVCGVVDGLCVECVV